MLKQIIENIWWIRDLNGEIKILSNFQVWLYKDFGSFVASMYVHLCAYNIIAPNYFLTGRNMRIDNIYVLGMYLSYLA